MKKKHKKQLQDIKDTMIEALEIPVKNKNGSYTLTGDWITDEHDAKDYESCDVAFTVSGEETDVTYLVQITKIDL